MAVNQRYLSAYVQGSSSLWYASAWPSASTWVVAGLSAKTGDPLAHSTCDRPSVLSDCRLHPTWRDLLLRMGRGKEGVAAVILVLLRDVVRLCGIATSSDIECKLAVLLRQVGDGSLAMDEDIAAEGRHVFCAEGFWFLLAVNTLFSFTGGGAACWAIQMTVMSDM